jgi:hypothetical protein
VRFQEKRIKKRIIHCQRSPQICQVRFSSEPVGNVSTCCQGYQVVDTLAYARYNEAKCHRKNRISVSR